MYLNLIITLIISLLGIGINCSDNSITPVEVKPGRRDYVWYVDTLKTSENSINGIDGVSQNDVWAVTVPGNFRQTFYHFDGVRWTTDSVYRPFSPLAIEVISSTDIWCVGEEGGIWRYDGSTWQQSRKIVIDSSVFTTLYYTTGTSSNLFMVGSICRGGSKFYSLIYHYDGNHWSPIQIGNYPVQLYKISPFPFFNKYLIVGIRDQQKLDESDTSKIYEFDGHNLNEIYSAAVGPYGWGDISPIATGLIISKGMKIYFSDGIGEKQLVDVENIKLGNSIFARSEKDIFLAMLDGIAHFNGTDIKYLFKYDRSTVYIHGIKFFDKSVFIIAHDYDMNVNYIFRGYLKQ